MAAATPGSIFGHQPPHVKFWPPPPFETRGAPERRPTSLRRSWHDPPVSVVGIGSRRLEGREKVVGSTRYTADLELPGLLHVQLVLSHLASARIRGIDLAAAKSAPGVIDVVTGADLPAVAAPSPEKPLAVGRVFYVGQPVVAVIAGTEAAALDAAALVEVDYEPLPPTVDAEAAMKEGAEMVLDVGETADADDASMHGAGGGASDEAPVRRPPNVSGVIRLKRGDTTAALASADVVVKGTYRLAGVHHSALEPHVCMVRPEPDGGMTVWAPTQGPFFVRNEVATVLGIPAHKVRVVSMPVGGGFGGKVTLLEALLVLLARKTGRALRLNLTRQQVFGVAKGAPAAAFDLELGAKRDGTLTAVRALPLRQRSDPRLARRDHRIVPHRHVQVRELRYHRLRGFDQQDAGRRVPRPRRAAGLLRP